MTNIRIISWNVREANNGEENFDKSSSKNSQGRLDLPSGDKTPKVSLTVWLGIWELGD